MNSKNNLKFGKFCEDLAAAFLAKRGYKILTRNFRRPWGEADIIARKAGVIFFVEVKAYAGSAPAGFEPEMRVDFYKIKKLKKIAQTFIQDQNLHDYSWQIDIVTVEIDKERGVARFRHFKNITA